jgi:hypothetical protein
MDLFEFTIDGIKYEYMDSKKINNKNYILYTDGDKDYISEYDLIDGQLKISPIDEYTFNMVKEEFEI